MEEKREGRQRQGDEKGPENRSQKGHMDRRGDGAGNSAGEIFMKKNTA
jgi:hypothetical protein